MAKLNTSARKRLPAEEFAEPKKRAYPIQGSRPQCQGPRKSGRQGRSNVEG
jgi:hypothetical protein